MNVFSTNLFHLSYQYVFYFMSAAFYVYITFKQVFFKWAFSSFLFRVCFLEWLPDSNLGLSQNHLHRLNIAAESPFCLCMCVSRSCISHLGHSCMYWIYLRSPLVSLGHRFFSYMFGHCHPSSPFFSVWSAWVTTACVCRSYQVTLELP